MQPEFIYLPITSIDVGESGVQLTAEHGLAGDWPVWVRGVSGMPDLNRDPRNALPWRAKRLDAATLEINALSGAGCSREAVSWFTTAGGPGGRLGGHALHP
ncbi:hypothetical protein ACRS3X_17055 [Ectopseudomonas hydrolytica]|uniref:hypothetical protein n=1 Tax=Ectopseudomonas hydrolytica TaxID=2493633 RepID=UPI003EE10E16